MDPEPSAPQAGLGRSNGGTGTTTGRRILVVEDDDSIAEPMITGLEREGFEVTRATCAREALESDPGDMVLLDLGLPDLDGSEVTRRIRAHSDVGIIVVTARGEELDRVLLLESGADDYIVKPFSMRELVARVRAVQRRIGHRHGGTDADDGPRTVSLGALHIDERARRVLVDGNEIELTPKEFDLLSLLAGDPGAVFTHEQIMAEVWDENWWGSTKTLDVHLASLRKKLANPNWIVNIRGVGFRLDPQP